LSRLPSAAPGLARFAGSTAIPGQPAAPTGLRINLQSAVNSALAFCAFTGAFVFVEPSPFEIAFLAVTFAGLAAGARLSAVLLPLAFALIGWLVGGFLSLVPVIGQGRAVQFFIISVYMAVIAIVTAVLLTEHTEERLTHLRRGYALGAIFAALAGIVGFFDLAGLGELFTLNNRARGTFKDPNVLGPFLILPALYCMHRLLRGETRRVFVNFVLLGLFSLGVFFTFSRGAWGIFVGSTLMLFGLNFLTAPKAATRWRIVTLGATAIGMLAVILAIALTFEPIRTVFEIRFSLKQDYDLGETGRFGSQLRSIPLLLDRPNGLGPMQFRVHFPEDPHNVYINAFASYGWIGGICYVILIAATWFVGWRLVFKPAPWQSHAIVVWSVLCVQTLQGLQIDSDHWRHFFLLLGMLWGIAAATRSWEVRHVSTARAHLRASTQA
jgi:O-antigen ligase